MNQVAPINAKVRRVLYCEGNVDGTIGGSFYSLLYLVERLDRTRYHPVVVFHREHALIPRFRAAGIETHVVPLRPPFHLDITGGWRKGISPILRLVQKTRNLWRRLVVESARCIAILRNQRIDLVHLNNSVVRNHHWMMAAWLTRTPCLTHERGINARYGALARFFAARLDAVVCISGAVQENLRKKQVRVGRLVLIHNGINVDSMRATTPANAVRRTLGIPEDAPVIGLVGNIKEWKGQEVVVRAAARLRERWPDLRCLLVGDAAQDDRYYQERLLRLIRELSLESCVTLTGYRRDVPDYMNVMDIVVHASILPEPFGRVIIEAMALAKPVVGSRDGGVTEIVSDGKTGLMFPPGDHAALAEAVSQLLADPTRRHSMGQAARRRVEQEFDIARNVSRTTALYETVLSARIGGA